MGFLRGVWLVLTFFLIIISLFLLGINYSTSQVLEVEYYDYILNESNSYELLSAGLVNSQASFVKIPSNDNISRVEGVRQLTLKLIGNTLSYLKDETDVLDLTVEIDVDSITYFFITKIESLPYCSTNPKINIINRYDSEGNIVCRGLNESSQEILYSYLEKQNMSFILEQRTYNLAQTFDKDGNLANIKPYVKYYLMSEYILIGIIFLLVLLTLIFSIHKEYSAFRLLGISVIISSGLLLYFHGFITLKISQIDFGNTMNLFLPNSSTLTNMLFNPLLNNLKTYTITLLSIGLVIFLISFVMKRKPAIKDKEVQKNEKKK